MNRWLIAALLTTGCATNYVVKGIEAEPGTLSKLEAAAAKLGCKTRRYSPSVALRHSQDPGHAWVYEELWATCEGIFVAFRQRSYTNPPEVWVHDCEAPCQLMADRIATLALGRMPERQRAAPKREPVAQAPAPVPPPLEVEVEPAPAEAAAVAVPWDGTFRGDRAIGELVTSCKARGQETCGNAIDDDCDGRYDDRGCGISSGALQWTLWWEGPADLDLHVVGPDDKDARAGAGAIVLDRSCTGSAAGASCIENAYLPATAGAAPGTYRVWVALVSLKGAPADEPVRMRLAGRIGNRLWRHDLALAPRAGAAHRLAFAVGGDRDGDGVADGEDACPDAPGRWLDDAAARGCPDRDQDGVPDSEDACAAKPGLTQAAPTANGCPLVFGEASVTNSGVTITSRIEFDTGRATLRPASRKTLADVARALKARPGKVRRLAVEGHTDATGTRKFNLRLSQRRAEAVVDLLVAEGIDRSMLVAQGYADLRPRAEGHSAEAKQQNRRVEFVVLDPRPRAPERW